MQTSRFQLGLIATLAVGLGFSLASSQAIGYPAGAAVSYGSNPVWSVGGEVDGDGEVVLPLDIPDGQVAVVSDVVFSAKHRTSNCAGHVQFDLETGGATVAAMAVQVSSWYRYASGATHQSYGYAHSMLDGPSVLPVHFGSGLHVASEEELTLRVSTDMGCTTLPTSLYTVSGYYAQP